MSSGAEQLGPKANSAKKSISISFHPPVPSCERRWCGRLGALTRNADVCKHDHYSMMPRSGKKRLNFGGMQSQLCSQTSGHYQYTASRPCKWCWILGWSLECVNGLADGWFLWQPSLGMLEYILPSSPFAWAGRSAPRIPQTRRVLSACPRGLIFTKLLSTIPHNLVYIGPLSSRNTC